jgi:4-diphosphocytidyl-2-C-methyl-D-erythritol kinase
LNRTITIPSYAKVNYTLDILSKRPDGFHNLASVMQAISLYDTITLTARYGAGIELTTDALDVPTDETNLAYGAAQAILEASGHGAGLGIHLAKRIPAEAGLGGGSSNAAYTLLGVNRLLGLGLTGEALQSLASSLGSDVPFFLTGGTAVARGRGESLTALPDGPPLWFVIVKPDINVSTAWAYNALDSISDRSSARATRRMEEALREGDPDRIISRMTNDFEQAILGEHLTIALLHDEFLMARAQSSRLCGSGSAVFGVARNRKQAEEIARVMRLKYADVHVCHALSRTESLSLGLPEEPAT